MDARVLVVGPPAEREWPTTLEREGWRVEERSTTQRALSVLATTDVACVVVEAPDAVAPVEASRESEAADDEFETADADRRDTVDPLDALAGVREFGHEQPVVLVSGRPDGELAAAATRLGVTEYHPRSATEASIGERVRAHLPADGPAKAAAGEGTGAHANDEAATRTGDGAATHADGGEPVADSDGSGDPEGVPDVDAGVAETALAAVDDGLYVLDREGIFVDVNETLAEMAGYDPGELVGEHVSLITNESAMERVFPEIRRVVRGEVESVTFETTVVPREGAPVPAEDHLTAITEDGDVVGVAGVIRDVSDQRERREELERYEAIIEAVDDGVYALDDEGRFEVVNDALVEITEYDRGELLGEHTSTIKDERTVQRAENKLREIVYGNSVETTFELELQPRSGDPIEAEDHMTLLTDERGAFAGTAGVIRDVSDRKERERELRRARERFAELLESSRALLGAHSRERVAEIVADAVADSLGYELTVVRLYDPERDRLEPVAGGESGPIRVGDRPDYAPGEGGPGRAFEAGAILHAPDDVEPDAVDFPPSVEETLYVPLGEAGTVSIGAAEPDAFDDLARSLAEILASNAAVALERVAREAELVQYRTVLENVQDMVYVADEAGRFSLVTEPLAAWLGLEREELVGAPVASVLADASAVEAVTEGVRSDGSVSRTLETAFERTDGERLPGEIEVSPLPAEDGFAGTVGVVRDRTELVETRERLETQRDRFSYLFDNLPDAVVEASLDDDGRPVVTTVNDAFTDVFGYDAETVVGESINEFVLPEDERETGRRLDQRAAAGEVVQQEVRRETADGYRDFLFRGVPYSIDGEGTNSFGIYTDITDQKERERRLQVLNRVLRHNLRNDLNVVLGYAEMIAGRVDDDTVTEWAETLIRTASDVASLSDRARSLDRTMREGSLRDHSVAIGGVVDSVVEEYRDECPAATIETEVDDVSVVGDGRIELALTELLKNSVEYGGERVRVRIESERERARIALSVADDGPGIPEYERIAVDDASEITQLEHASGLGLWIVRWVCDSCGGRMRFEESDLGGTAVVLSLTPAAE
ncbi:MAG: PAS domain S-box protein [Halosimplex sp.]